MSKRKTIQIQRLRDIVNNRNINSTASADERSGWNSLLSEVLHSTGNYKGFAYLRSSELPADILPGIVFDAENGNHQYPDPSRIVFY